MPRKNSRLILNRAAIGAVELGLGDGMGSMMQEILAATHPPDAEPFGEGLIESGGWAAFVRGKKIGGTAQKPREERPPRTAITGIVGFDFPARFQEEGTVNQPARPFLTPGADSVLPGAAGHLRRGVGRRVPR